jgi:hypothetical protein
MPKYVYVILLAPVRSLSDDIVAVVAGFTDRSTVLPTVATVIEPSVLPTVVIAAALLASCNVHTFGAVHR